MTSPPSPRPLDARKETLDVHPCARPLRLPSRDAQANFHGNILVFVHWEDHLSFCSAVAFPLPPDMPFGALLADVLPAHYGKHPDWARADLGEARWLLDGRDFTPDPGRSLADQGVGHKSLLRFWTPGLNGYEGSFS